ncbi:MAG TPA: MBL fold metallo-hydrolase, partial [Candidatus Limnocylindrales bacterium]|nr:MBL fold metallo-hydrolase [Candidatus Limnocylindrales bacterium]
ETDGQRLLTDPVLRNRIGSVRRRAEGAVGDVEVPDAVLISHLHHDHLDRPSMRRLPTGTMVVGPVGTARVLRGFSDVREVDVGGRVAAGAVAITAVPARHGGRRMPSGPAAPALGYLIEGEHRIYFAGDTDIFPAMADLAPGLDLAILPVGGWGPTLRGGHMDPERAASALTLLRPRVAVAVHWGTLWPTGMDRVRRARFEEPARRFVEAARAVAPDVSVALLDPGGYLILTGDGSIEVGAGADEPG